MNFTVCLMTNGVPDDSLSPVINIWEAGLNGTQVKTNEPMDRIASSAGGYTFEWAEADTTKNYYAEAFASGLPAGQQYAPCITSVQGAVAGLVTDMAFVRGIEGGSWKIDRTVDPHVMNFYNEADDLIKSFELTTSPVMLPQYSERIMQP